MQIPHKLAILFAKLVDAGCGPIHAAGDEYRCRCPAHEDQGPSLYIGLGDQRLLIRDNAGCSIDAICDSLDLGLSDLSIADDDPWVTVDDEFQILEEVPPPEQQVTAVPTVAVPDEQLVAPAEIYAELLSHLELTSAHFDDLVRRGLNQDEIEQRGYRSADVAKIRAAVDDLLQRHGREALLSVPGFTMRDGRVRFVVYDGLLIPVRAIDGSIVALKVRHDDGNGGPKYTWASTRERSCGTPVHVPIATTVPTSLVRLTEGELKADVAVFLSGTPTISAPGVTSWAEAIPILQALGARQVYVAFDQDGQPGTLACIEQAILGLSRAGFEVQVEWWDGDDGKGIDDLLAAGKQPEVLAGLAALVRVRDLLTGPHEDQIDGADSEPAPFPLDVLPPALAEYCQQVADATSTPPDFAAQTVLVTAGAAIGNSRALCIKERVWYESPRIYALNIGDPSTGKTPAMETVVDPYQAIQLQMITEYQAAKQQFDAAEEEFEHAAKVNRSLAADDKMLMPSLPPEPAPPERLVVDDATVEALVSLLESNPRGLLMPQDEGVAWVRGMNQYRGGKGNDRQFWLKAWPGKMHISDRKSNGRVPITSPRPFINVICGLPPDMLAELGDRQYRRDGFLDRLLAVFPTATIGADWTEATVTLEAQQVWERTLRRLRSLQMMQVEGKPPTYRAVRLTPAARERWIAWWDQHAAEIRSPTHPAQLISPWGKLRTYVARFTLLLHYLWLVQSNQAEHDVDVASVEHAIRLIDYYKTHLPKVYGRLRQSPEDTRIIEVLDWVRQRGGQCRARDLANSKKVTPTDKAKKVLKELEERGYGRLEWREARNGRKVQWFVFDPK